MAHNTTRVSALLRYSLLILCTAGGPALFAQSSTITGLVTDPNGANIPEAPVTITNTATGVARRVPTNTQGYFTAPSLPNGDYSIHPGPRDGRREGGGPRPAWGFSPTSSDRPNLRSDDCTGPNS